MADVAIVAHIPKTAHTMIEVLAAVEKGITQTGTAKVLHCDRETIRRYCKRWKAVEDAVKGKRCEMVDLAEMGLRGAVLRGEAWAVAFALKTLGKNDGYTERTEIAGPEGERLAIRVIYDTDTAASSFPATHVEEAR